MKRLFPLLLLLSFATVAQAQYVKVLGIAEQGGKIITSGVTSTTSAAKTFPGATITIYSPTGSGTVASIFSASTGTVKANPFSASLTDATFDFFILPGSTFDVRISGISGGVTITAFTRSGYTAPGTGVSLALCGGTADTALLTALNALGGTIEIPKGVTCASNSQTISAALQVDKSGLLKPITGQTVTLTGEQNKDTWRKFTNATTGLGTISFAGNITLDEIYMEWWGATANGSTDFTPYFNAAAASLPSNEPGINGGTIKLLIGNYRTTGITMPDKQINIIGSGGIGNVGGTCTAPTQITSITNAPIIKYAWYVGANSYRERLENLAICGNSAGTSQHGVWIDNGGINYNNISINNVGGNGVLISHSNGTDYSRFEIHGAGVDGIRIQPSVSSNVSAGVNNNTFHRISIGSTATGKVGVHFLCGAGNLFWGVDIENEAGASRAVHFDHQCASEVLGNKLYGVWSENTIVYGGHIDAEFDGASQGNYIEFVRPIAPTVVAGSPGIGNGYFESGPYGTPQTDRRTQFVVGTDSSAQAGVPGIKISTGHLNFVDSTQRIKWGAGLAQLGVSSSTNVQLLDSAGSSAGSLTLGLATSPFTSLKRSGTGVMVRNGDDSADGALTAGGVRVTNVGNLRLAPKTNDTYAATVSIDVTIGSHVIASSFTTSAASTFNASAGGTAGDILVITTEADASGTTTITFGTNFKSSGTQATTASHFSTIVFQSDGTRFLEISRTTALAWIMIGWKPAALAA